MTDRRIEQLEAAFEKYGYIVGGEAIPGQEDIFVNNLKQGLTKVESVLEFNAKTYGFRGLSKNAIKALHEDVPNPAFGVDRRCDSI